MLSVLPRAVRFLPEGESVFFDGMRLRMMHGIFPVLAQLRTRWKLIRKEGSVAKRKWVSDLEISSPLSYS